MAASRPSPIPTPALIPDSRGCDTMIARAITRMRMIKAVTNIAKRSLFAHAIIRLVHPLTASRLKAMSTKGMDTPADTDTIAPVSYIGTRMSGDRRMDILQIIATTVGRGIFPSLLYGNPSSSMVKNEVMNDNGSLSTGQALPKL